MYIFSRKKDFLSKSKFKSWVKYYFEQVVQMSISYSLSEMFCWC